MQSIILPYQNARIHCLRFGQGPQLLIAFHGFGDRARMFAVLEEGLTEQYTVVAVDWPLHGQTEWPDLTFNKEDLLNIIQLILQSEEKSRFSLMGFSFGARLVQSMLPELAGQLDKLFLLSPDGVETKGMTIAVRTPVWMRRFLYRSLQRPEWFLNLLQLGRKMGVVPPLIQHFLATNLTRADRFRRTFGCWLSLDAFYLPRHKIKEILRTTGLPTDIYFGTKDQMIRFESLKKMTEGLPNVHLFLLDEGHRLVGESLRDTINVRRPTSDV
jgi:pimeloyl-ACP methyl ester carboxylesterase